MKTKIATFILLSTSLFAGKLSENLAITEKSISSGEYEIFTKDSIKSFGHYIFSISPSTTLNDMKLVIPSFLFGYQSAIDIDAFMESASIEFGGGISNRYYNQEQYFFFHPRMLRIKYLNPTARVRHYGAIGLSIMSMYKSAERYADRAEGTYLASSLAIGSEIGSSDRTMNKIQVSFDQPILAFDSANGLTTGPILLSFCVGF